MYLADFTSLADSCRDNGGRFATFRRTNRILGLAWPEDVVEQWLYDHSNNETFLPDYAAVELTGINWELEALRAVDIAALPIGSSDGNIIDKITTNPDH